MLKVFDLRCDKSLVLWQTFVFMACLVIGVVAIVTTSLYDGRSNQLSEVEVQGKGLVSATLLRSEIVHRINNGEKEFLAKYSLENSTSLPLPVRITSKSCSCNRVMIADREIEADGFTIEPSSSLTVTVAVPFPASVGTTDHQVVLAEGSSQFPRPLRIRIRLLDDLELLPSLIEAKSVKAGAITAQCEVVARVRAGDQAPRPSAYTVRLANARDDAKLAVNNSAVEPDTEFMRTFRLRAELTLKASALTEKYNYFDLLGAYDGEVLSRRTLTVYHNPAVDKR